MDDALRSRIRYLWAFDAVKGHRPMPSQLAPAPTHLAPVLCWSRPPLVHAFTMQDRIALDAWQAGADRHGYTRVVIEPGAPGSRPDGGSYALIYRPAWPWAAWGLARRGETVLAWHCGTGADFGRFPSFQLALAALPPAAYRQAVRRAAASAMSASGPQ